MDKRKLILIAAALIVFAVVGLVRSQRALNSDSGRQRASLYEVASVAPVETAAPHPPLATKTASQTPSPTPAEIQNVIARPTSSASPTTAAQPLELTNPDDDLSSSQTRLNAIDQISTDADDLFSPSGADPSWSVNQQGMDQIDYDTQDGSTAITKWYSPDDGNGSSIQAEEAQLPNGELVDRWYNESGGVQQVMHQYDKNNSYSVYRYDDGRVEATRVIKDGNEIFTKYDHDGRQIQRTYTPASEN